MAVTDSPMIRTRFPTIGNPVSAHCSPSWDIVLPLSFVNHLTLGYCSVRVEAIRTATRTGSAKLTVAAA